MPSAWSCWSGRTPNVSYASGKHGLIGLSRNIAVHYGKIAALKEISARLGIRHEDVIAVGDGANDLGMLHLAGAGVALHAKPSVAAQCDIRINHGDLTALLYIQGYAAEDFAISN